MESDTVKRPHSEDRGRLRVWALAAIGPVLLAMYPVLFLLQRNWDKMIPPDAIRPLLWAAAAGLAVVLVPLVLTRRPVPSSLSALAWVAAIVAFPLYRSIPTLEDMHGRLFAGACALAALATYGCYKRAGSLATFHKVVTVAAALLVAMPSSGLVLRAARYEAPDPLHIDRRDGDARVFGRPQGDPWAAVKAASEGDTPRPNIYYVMLDEYARSDVLLELFGYDNTPFLEFLETNNFFVAHQARANYNQTIPAMTAALNLAYLDWLAAPEVPERRIDSTRDLVPYLQDNEAFAFLRAWGYSIWSLSVGFDLAEIRSADVFADIPAGLSEFEAVLLGNTPLSVLPGVDLSAEGLEGLQRRRMLHHLDWLEAVPSAGFEKPRLFYCHLLSPHPPFVFDRDGNVPKGAAGQVGMHTGTFIIGTQITRGQFAKAYVDQLHYLNGRLQRIVDAIVQQDPEAVVIIHSDHGSSTETDWLDAANTNWHERMGVLMAIRLPGHNLDSLPQTLSPVNVFRVVFNRLFGTDTPLLTDRSYASPMDDASTFEPVEAP